MTGDFMSANLSIVGTDGVVPTYNPNGLWAIWDINVVYNGGPGEGMYVPKINDYVINPPTGTLYIVTNLNMSNYLSTLQQINIASISTLANPDQLIAPYVPHTSNAYRLYFNSETNPYTFNVDAFLVIYNATATTVKFFLGNNFSLNNLPKALTVSVDNNGNALSDSVQLISYAPDNTNNQYMKIIPTAYTNTLLQNGDTVTVVLYNAEGGVVSFEYLTVVVTNAYIGMSAPTQLVTGLSLQSPFVSTTEPNTLLLPSNVSPKDLDLYGVVTYNDGTQNIMPVNQSGQFMVYGLEQVYKANLFETVSLVLQYTLGTGEQSYSNQNYNGKVVTNKYTLKMTNPNFDYQFRLYPVPVYSGTSGYMTKWFILSMSRNLFLDVTDLVTFSSGSNFNGTTYNNQQSQTISVQLSYINNSYTGLNYSQESSIMLFDPSQGPSTPFSIWSNSNTSSAPYGVNLRAKALNTSATSLDITCQYYELNGWLNAVYYANQPVYNPQLESSAPAPTHFDIYYAPQGQLTGNFMSDAQRQRFMIAEWNSTLNLGTQSIPLYSTILIRFLQVIGDTTLVLGISPMMITQY